MERRSVSVVSLDVYSVVTLRWWDSVSYARGWWWMTVAVMGGWGTRAVVVDQFDGEVVMEAYVGYDGGGDD